MSTQRNNPIAKAIRFALIGGAAAAAFSPAYAADEEVAEEKAERIEVTGSRIKRTDVETTQPIQVVTREDIAASGLVSVYDVLNNLNISDGSGLSTVTTQTNGSDGSEQISLRGLGAGRTLVLVDGKRWITDIDATVDLSTIPMAVIERIEVLKDGASAIYGSDAIGGVINIITRRDYEGATAGVYFGQTAKNDGDTTSIDLTVGASADRYSAVLSIANVKRDPIMASDRSISLWPYYGCEELSARPDYNTTGSLANFLGSFCGSGSNEGGSFAVPGLPGRQTLIPGQDGQDAADFRAFTNSDRYNFAPVNYLQQPTDRTNIFAAGWFDITDNVTANARISYTKRVSDQQLAEVPLLMNTNGSQGPQWTIPIAADQYFNPFDQQINASNFRMVAAGPRNPKSDYDIYSIQLGFKGSFEVGDRVFDWDVFGQLNDGQYDQSGTGYINLFNLRNALGTSFRDGAGVLRCGTPGNVINNCVPLNIFGGADLGLGAGVITQAEYDAMVNYVSYTRVSTAGNSSHNVGATLSGEIVELPAGMLAFAAGVETRRDEAFSQPDTLVASGGSSDNFSEPTKGSVTVDDMFIEIVAPIVSDLPGFKSLELSAASRKTEYDSTGLSGLNEVSPDIGNPTTNKIGLRWQVFDDLLIRASKGDTFRAPSVNDLFGGGAESFPQAADPCRQDNWNNLSTDARQRCINAGVPGTTANNTGVPGDPISGANDTRTQLRALLGGNPFSLRPEEGENTSVGFVYNPSWLEGFDIAVDYWKVDLTDAITTRSATNILSGCYTNGTQPEFCSFVERAPDGVIATVRTAGFNASEFLARGIDLGANYKMDTEFGAFRFKLEVTKNLNIETNGVDEVGLYTGSPNFEYRAQFRTNWQYGDFDVNWTTRFMSELVEPCFVYCYVRSGFNDDVINNDDGTGRRAGSTTYHDLQVNYNTPWKGRVSVGARNVFGKEPPVLQYNSFAHSFDASYDLPGGPYMYASYRQEF